MKTWNPKVKEERPTCPLVSPSNSRCLQKCVCLIVHGNGNHSCMFYNALETFAKAGEIRDEISKHVEYSKELQRQFKCKKASVK